LTKEAALQKAVVEIIQAGLVDSAHDCSEGGLAVVLAEKAFPKGIGLKVSLESQGLPPEFVLFGEDASRIVLSCDPGNVPRIKEVAGKHGVLADAIGETIPKQMAVELDGRTVISAPVSELSDAYEGALEWALKTEPERVSAN
jgi:phosphoribosylformylglycinamidine synthase subunit PurL